MKVPVECLCGGVGVPLVQNGQETAFPLQDGIARLHVCQACGHLRFFSMPGDQELATYYNGPWNAAGSFRIEDSYERWHEKLPERQPHRTFIETLLRLREQHFAGNRPVVLHDVGCGYGAMIAKLNLMGFDAWGSDIDREAIDAANIRGNHRLYQCHFTELPEIMPTGVDMMTAYHTAEHYPNPLEFFRIV